MSAEQLMHWIAEVGAGSLDRFAETQGWALGDTIPFHRTLRGLADLGAVEIDWSRRRWGAVAPAVALLPDAAGYGLIVGARTARLTHMLLEELDELDALVQPIEQENAALALFVAADSARALETVARDVGIAYEGSVAGRLGAVLPPLNAMLRDLRTARIGSHYGVERYGLEDGWLPAMDDRDPGFYRYEVSGPRTLQFIDDDGVAYRTDLSLGSWAEARRQGRDKMLYWRPDGTNGTLDAPGRLPLPPLHARAATLCSGLTARWDGKGGLLYSNVPRWLALKIAATLDQPLHET